MTMSIHSSRPALAALILAGMLSACSSTKLDTDVPVESRTPVASGTGGATSGAAQSQVTPVDLEAANRAALMNMPRVVYFDYDSYVVKDDFRNVVEANARALSADRKRHIAVEGHTDDRGGSEYNLALGQKRAEATAKSLKLLGANDSQIEAVSFGKERPAVEGESEAAWSKNRRAEITYR